MNFAAAVVTLGVAAGPVLAGGAATTLLAGGEPRRLDTFTDRRRRVTGLDLGPARATWAVPTRILVRGL